MDIKYSLIDKTIHHLSFDSKLLTSTLNDIESFIYSKYYSKIAIKKPIFITSLPRAGTTVLLTSLYSSKKVKSYTYRNMPFIMNPILWSNFNKNFGRERKSVLRAHNDGMYINYDSPEAFEEVIWKYFYSEKFSSSSLPIWTDNDMTFSHFLKEEIRKLLYSQGNSYENIRYLSKNNTNIARIQFLQKMFPDSIILVPFREPNSHIYSLYTKHNLFKELHSSDPFSLRYMADIGHYEFGKLHRPIQFPSFKERTSELSAETIDYWYIYWISAFNYLKGFNNIHFLCYEELCRNPEYNVEKLFNFLDLKVNEEELNQATSLIHSAPVHMLPTRSISTNLKAEAESLYQTLIYKCIFHH